MLANSPVNTMVRALDKERAKRFYTETLGLTLVLEQDHAFVVKAGEGTCIAVYQRENMPVPQNNVAIWQVPDVTAVARDLIKRGVEPERFETPGVDFDNDGIAILAGNPTLWFKDSEDNIHMVTTRLV
jgi:catechol 2,3-dioxygenase-like lactoylglutathione lyase family enzyme